ncbi:tetratricopeptide repeat protein [Mangrovimonas cancribranchiae]|uniref:Protein involved in gliding motility SprE n=1 Tax=Mangrovimonas cancribranchiae TaxID=3080055 RepID=A0AAU6P729_9FLAO
MKTSFRLIVVLFSIILVVSSCSRKKDRFLSRNYHAVTAEYNTLFNGYNALELGRQSLNESYEDDYWEILPIERMQIMEEVMLPGQNKNENFSRAEEKAIKAVQMHGMNINGKEKNPQIDEAYLLLGEARYFDQRFIPALEAFNYILYRYPSSDKINQAKVWREKTNIRLENDELAIENLKELLEEADAIEGQDLADATSMLAQAYINTKSLDSAITQLEIAAQNTKSHDERGRYRFIQGQLYNELGKKDSANYAFDKIIELNRRTPRVYLINAHIQKAKNFNYDDGNKLEFLELLTDLEKNRENRPFLDKIYHQIGEYHMINGSDSLALANYNKSLRTNSRDKKLKARNYEILGDYEFDYANYKIAGAYYDSTMLNMEKNKKPYRIIKRKRDNLEDVIYYEDVAKATDSILTLVAMSDDERLAYFEAFTTELKAQAEEEKEKQKSVERQQGLATVNNDIKGKSSRGMTPSGKESSFYFYNSTTVAYGKNEFVRIWGDRPLEDDWRWSSKRSTKNNNTNLGQLATADTDSETFDPNYYIEQLPQDDKVIDSIAKERNFAYYQLGVIYKEKFKEYQLSKDKFLSLLDNNPEEKLILPSKYNLYKIYEVLNQQDEASIAKNDIITNYPESRYAKILLNPEQANLKDENSPESIYQNLYKELSNQNYQFIIDECDDKITLFQGDPMVPKFELLKALAIGRLNGFQEYSKAINYVALNYANTPEGIEAQNIVDEVLPALKDDTFTDAEDENSFKVVYYFNKTKDEEVVANFKTALNEQIKEVKVFNLKTSLDVYNSNTTFVVVHGLTSFDGANGYALSLQEQKENKIIHQYFITSSTNYRTIQIHKNLETYLELQINNN